MDRLTLAYSLIAFIVVAIAGLVTWRIYHGRERSTRRRHARDRAKYEATMNEKSG